ncbi:hypothetical protein [Streptomyces narbonensis]
MRTSSSRRGRRAAIAAVAVVVTGTTLLTGCGSDSDDGGGDAQGGGKITLRVGTFGSFGYDNKTGAKLYAEYEKAHPNIKIEETNVSDGQKYWDTLKLRLAQNNGILDIEQRGTDPAKAWENVKKLVDDKIDQ